MDGSLNRLLPGAIFNEIRRYCCRTIRRNRINSKSSQAVYMTHEVEFYADAFKLAYLLRARSGEFKTTHEVEGREVVVTRGPGGQFASTGGAGNVDDDNSHHPLDFVTTTIGRQLDNKAFGEQAEKLKVTIANTFGLEVQLPKLNVELPFKEKLSAALDGVKEDIDKIKDVLSDPEKVKKLAGTAIGRAIPASIFLAQTVAPDVLIGLALGESIPVVLGGAAFFAALSGVSGLILKHEKLEDNLAAQAITGIASLLIAGGVTKAIASAVAASKFGTTGVHQILEAGKTADELKATFQAVDKHIKDFVKPGSEQVERQRERFLTALSHTAERAQGTNKGSFFQSLSDRAGHLLSLPTLAKDLRSHVEKELKTPNLKAALDEVGVDAQKLSDRLAEMCNLESIPRILHKQRADEVKLLVQRVKELPNAVKAASKETNEYKELLAELTDTFRAIEEMPRGLPDSRRNLQGALERLTLSLDKINGIELGAKWRADLINTEISSGALLDNFLHGRASGKTGEELASRYEAFMGNLVKDKPKKIKTRIISDKELLTENEGSQMIAESWGTPEFRGLVLKDSQKTVDLFSRLSPVNMDVDLTAYSLRPYSIFEDDKPTIVNVGTGGAQAIFHELTHVVEKQLKEGLEIASAFRGDRVKIDYLLEDLSSLGMPGEKAIIDSFVGKYTGKIYPGSLHGEIYTTAMQEVATAHGLYNLAIQDREHLTFTLSQFLK